MYLHVSTGLIFPYKNFFRVSSRKIFPKKRKKKERKKDPLLRRYFGGKAANFNTFSPRSCCESASIQSD